MYSNSTFEVNSGHANFNYLQMREKNVGSVMRMITLNKIFSKFLSASIAFQLSKVTIKFTPKFTATNTLNN